MPPKEHFRLFVRANAIRQRSSAYTPWIVSEDLVKRYTIPSKLASIFTNPKVSPAGRKRKADPAATEGAVKKMKATDISLKQPKVDPPPPLPQQQQQKQQKPRGRPGRKPGTKVKRDPNAPKKKPGPKPGFKRTPKTSPKTEPPHTPSKVKVKTEASDSDDDVALAVLAGQANRQVKVENGAGQTGKDTPRQNLPRKREIKMSQKMRQATLFDMRTPTKEGKASHSPRKAIQGRVSVAGCRST